MRRWRFCTGHSTFTLVERSLDLVRGPTLAPDHALRVVALGLRGEALPPLRAAYRALSGDTLAQAASVDALLRWFALQLGADTGSASHARLSLLALDASPGADDADPEAPPSATEILAREIAAQTEGALVHQGQQYLFRAGSSHAAVPGRAAYEALSHAAAAAILQAMAAEPSRAPVLRDLLQRAARLFEVPPTAEREAPVLLRRERQYQRPPDASAPATPSQLKRAKEVDFLEVQLVDVEGQPYANEAYEVTLPDGSKRRGSLNRDGYLYLADIPSGDCSVRFLKFQQA
ncbi:MAG TPA: hypothetical protein VFZ61_22650 [Polyangiales bacterium]